ncbi:MAG TPA: tetratricopeptide repeat protein [Vicinamibacterales bacterium]|jgi:tetratricopeptide (TPR) repeat protein|nr:tetratricopeptide repeat protein [Vicinamibacterales bacterium]
MKLDAVVYTVAGMAFGVILGWVIGSQQLSRTAQVPAAPAQVSQSAPPAGQATGGRAAPTLDQGRVDQLTAAINGDPRNTTAIVQLANVYFDAERFTDAISWYEKAIALDPKNADVSTDLGVSYYYTNRTDEALKRFEESLRIDPKHTKTLLNKGIVLAFGKEDLKGASVEWQKVVDLAPGSPEGEAARRALEGVAAAHANQTAAPNQQ